MKESESDRNFKSEVNRRFSEKYNNPESFSSMSETDRKFAEKYNEPNFSALSDQEQLQIFHEHMDALREDYNAIYQKIRTTSNKIDKKNGKSPQNDQKNVYSKLPKEFTYEASKPSRFNMSEEDYHIHNMKYYLVSQSNDCIENKIILRRKRDELHEIQNNSLSSQLERVGKELKSCIAPISNTNHTPDKTKKEKSRHL